MIDYCAFILILIFVPVIVFMAIKFYKPELKKLVVLFTFLLMALELVRFFYCASLYKGAVIPAKDLRLTYLFVLFPLAMFATFNKGKFGKLAQSIFCMTALAPTIIAFLEPQVYTNALDTLVVLRALYFLSASVSITLCLLYIVERRPDFSWQSLVAAAAFFLLYIAANAGAGAHWNTANFDWRWIVGMVLSLLSAGLIPLVRIICLRKKRGGKTEAIEENNAASES